MARFAETRIVAGDDPQKWEFFLTLSASETLNFDEENHRLIEAPRGSLKGAGFIAIVSPQLIPLQPFRKLAILRHVPTHKTKTHRSSAWGVLGSTTDGLPFLLTHPVVFRSN